MTELFLIAHKVRGEPALDVAINIGNEMDGDIWIIPTSGHRAYPHRYWNFEDLYDGSDMDMPKPLHVLDTIELPVTLRDHYAANEPVRARPPTRSPSFESKLEDLI